MNSPETTKTDGAEVKSEGRRALLKKLGAAAYIAPATLMVLSSEKAVASP